MPKNTIESDAADLRDAYVHGANIDTLAEEYGYTPEEVTAVVVKEAHEAEPVLQADEDDRDETTKPKKGK